MLHAGSNGKVSILVDQVNDPRILSPNGLTTFQRGYLTFNDFANDPAMQVSLAEMEYERKSGNKSTEPRTFHHYKKISKAFDRAKKSIQKGDELPEK